MSLMYLDDIETVRLAVLRVEERGIIEDLLHNVWQL